jgi:hypothetical protein
MKTSIRSVLVLLGVSAWPAFAALELPDPPPLKVRAQTIDDQIKIGYGLAIADVDGDGKPDILLADQAEIVWYQNPTWAKHKMTGQLTPKDHVCIAARDIDNDGRAEVAVGAEWNPGDTRTSGAVFYLIPPADRTQLWEAVKLPHEPTVHRMAWVRDHKDRYYLAVLPLHGRGNTDGVGEGVRLMGYFRPPNPKGVWETFLQNDAFHVTHNFDPVRWDGPDYGEELLLATKEGVHVLGWEDEHWKTVQVTTNATGEVRSGKLPSGRRFVASIEPFHGNELAVYTPTTTMLGRLSWTAKRALLDDSLIQGHALATGDLLGLGWDQVVAGWRGPVPMREGVRVGIKLYAPTDKRGVGWKQHAIIDDNKMACEDLKLADLNQDGRLDVIACGRATKNVIIYWNETTPVKP